MCITPNTTITAARSFWKSTLTFATTGSVLLSQKVSGKKGVELLLCPRWERYQWVTTYFSLERGKRASFWAGQYRFWSGMWVFPSWAPWSGSQHLSKQGQGLDQMPCRDTSQPHFPWFFDSIHGSHDSANRDSRKGVGRVLVDNRQERTGQVAR